MADGTDSTVAPIEHGGRLAAARSRWPGAPAPFLDLSTGINPVPYPLPDLPQDAWTRLPEPGAEHALRAAAAAAFGLGDPAMVVAAPGTQILISLLPALLPHRRIGILGPTYAEHEAAWRAAGATVSVTSDIAALAAADIAVLCNPNNPDGRRHAPASLLGLADALGARDGLLIVDEAFADLVPELSLAPALPHPGLLILRSFGKAYGLAGLRLGFALAAPPRAAALRRALGPWAVSGPALAIATTALSDSAWLSAARARLERDAARLDALLGRAGLQLLGGTPLFRLAASPHAAEIADLLGRAGLLVRSFRDHPSWLRFGLPPETAWDRLGRALEIRGRRGGAGPGCAPTTNP